LGSPTPNRIGPGLGTLPQGRLRFDRPTRVALCRCGASAYKPCRDTSHRRIDFRAVPEEVETLR
jgi:CDGSH-type Zn-finger protein